MEGKRPLGLLTIRRPDGDLETITIFTFFQNGADYLNTVGEAWEKIGELEYKTATGFVVKLEMVIPKHIDLRKEEYLWIKPDIKDEQKDTSR